MVNKCFGGWTFRHRWMDGRKESPEADVAHEKGDLRNNKNMFSENNLERRNKVRIHN